MLYLTRASQRNSKVKSRSRLMANTLAYYATVFFLCFCCSKGMVISNTQGKKEVHIVPVNSTDKECLNDSYINETRQVTDKFSYISRANCRHSRLCSTACSSSIPPVNGNPEKEMHCQTVRELYPICQIYYDNQLLVFNAAHRNYASHEIGEAGKKEKSGGWDTKKIVGVTIGVLLPILIAVGILIYWYYIKKRNDNRNVQNPDPEYLDPEEEIPLRNPEPSAPSAELFDHSSEDRPEETSNNGDVQCDNTDEEDAQSDCHSDPISVQLANEIQDVNNIPIP